jgi:SEC-C motif-containing protein
MRARYSAFATGREDYLFRTWHPRTRPEHVAPSGDLAWLRLEVGRTVGGGPGDDTGTVEFRAWFRSSDGEHVLHEMSRFERRSGRWLYVDGDVDRLDAEPPRTSGKGGGRHRNR